MSQELSIDQLKAKIGQEVGISPWIPISQDTIDAFADVTGDHQFIHVDAEKAAKTPFGGTIVHGFLTLSLLATMLNHSATIADLVSPSISTVTVWRKVASFGVFCVRSERTKRPRTRLPERTGETKRTLSNP